ncbi:unnamed protein product [Arctia plantaginis]|uniref:Carboxylesterase type B domain-containing protein n=1 Tax=Arctia plantaginis TaxID=874455 RepID=A0A8S0YUP1_ARCPL|nr:unnamed protein product [Arctia plantaginis]
MTIWRSLIVLCLIACVRSDEGKWRQIETPQGPVRGRRDPAGLYIFSNIPYATVPSGPNKFGAPSPPPIWLQPLETSNKPIICPQPIMPLLEEFKNMKRTMRDLWNNFVRHGKPVPEGSSFPSWPSADANRSPYMSLGQTMQLQSSLLESRARFWDDIYQRYYREPTPPPNPPKSEL